MPFAKYAYSVGVKDRPIKLPTLADIKEFNRMYRKRGYDFSELRHVSRRHHKRILSERKRRVQCGA